MNAELIPALTPLVLVIPAIVIIYGVLPPRRKPFMVDLLNARMHSFPKSNRRRMNSSARRRRFATTSSRYLWRRPAKLVNGETVRL